MGGLLHLVQLGEAWAGCSPTQSPPRSTKCNSPPINGQCANFVLLYVSLRLSLQSKGLTSNNWYNDSRGQNTRETKIILVVCC